MRARLGDGVDTRAGGYVHHVERGAGHAFGEPQDAAEAQVFRELSLPFLEAIRQFGNELPRQHAVYVHLTLMPYIPSAGELKTKPTQHSVKELLSIGIQPDILLCRTDRPIPKEERRKLSLFCNVRETAVIEARDVDNIYAVPEAYSAEGLDGEVLAAFGIEPGDAGPVALAADQRARPQSGRPGDDRDRRQVHRHEGRLQIADRGAAHGGIANKVKVNLDWIESEVFEKEDPAPFLEHVNGILVPGGFGQRGAEGKIRAAQFAREREVPYFGICFGMQMAVIEAARNLAGIEDANSTEFGADARAGGRADDRMAQGQRAGEARRRTATSAARCGSAPIRRCSTRGSRIAEIYGATEISERHRHRYEVNIDYKGRLEQHGMRFCRHVAGRRVAGDHRIRRPPVVHRRAVPPRAQVAAVRAAPAVPCFIGAAVERSRLVSGQRVENMRNGRRPRVYLAGPGVFRPDPVGFGEQLKAKCERVGLVGYFPLDNEIAQGSPPKQR